MRLPITMQVQAQKFTAIRLFSRNNTNTITQAKLCTIVQSKKQDDLEYKTRNLEKISSYTYIKTKQP